MTASPLGPGVAIGASAERHSPGSAAAGAAISLEFSAASTCNEIKRIPHKTPYSESEKKSKEPKRPNRKTMNQKLKSCLLFEKAKKKNLLTLG